VFENQLKDLSRFVHNERRRGAVCPSDDDNILKAFWLTPFENVRVVILGQDPYPRPEHAMGLAFSVPDGVRPFPLSLRNIDHELQSDLDLPPAKSGDLTPWAHRGVLLLNRALTVGANGHSHLAHWRRFTDRALQLLINDSRHPVVFLLWGSKAKVVRTRIERSSRHLVICGAHPVARNGFFGQKYFSRADSYLGRHRQVDWHR
jgi:uracil-DNA glycosylase